MIHKPSILWIFILAGAMIGYGWAREEEAARVEFPDGKSPVFGWQWERMAEPKGGPEFSTSAFVHPFTTPGGFVCTHLQPTDHKHHLGIWWPWKFVEVDGKKYNSWEIQMGEAAHVARSVKTISRTAERAEWEMSNQTIIKPKGAVPKVVIHETARIVVMSRDDAVVMDVFLYQKAAENAVTIREHHYSGFSWRGPASWNHENSTMTTSGGRDRDDANGTPARWVVVSGPADGAMASLLILSLAEKTAGTAEKLRVWDSKVENGTPFVNFNPVLDSPLPLNDATPAVSRRTYRLIAADRVIDSAEAEKEWKRWTSQ